MEVRREETKMDSNSSSMRRRSGEWEGKMKKKKGVVVLSELGRSKSLTDEDLDELKGCLDLGFGFSYDDDENIPAELCNTLPALELLCYSSSSSSSSFGRNNWKISISKGDDPEDVKERLKYWAQAVACTVKLK